MSDSERKKRAHTLYLAGNPAEFSAALREARIDLPALLDALLVPGAEYGLVLGGSIPERTGTSVSDVDLLVLINSSQALRDVASSLGAYPVKWLYQNRNFTSNWAVLYVEGIELNFEIKVNPDIRLAGGAQVLLNKNSNEVSNENVDHLRFLSRLSGGWALQNVALVDLWKRYYEIDRLRQKRMISEFSLAAKELEDMQAAIGGAPGLSAMLGIYVVTKLMKALLASHDYFSPGVKWLRKVEQLISSGPAQSASLLRQGRDLLFPSPQADREAQLAYFQQVLAYSREVERQLAQDPAVKMVIGWFNEAFDTLNR
ncbi:hypothetical protein SAMN05518865_111132 [Duganella sp. CF458]|uniref:hypothetical protein n=1 Tax=Duganella sp. CF458 TaxID=1884368 RepID=UPI0008E7000F|nr:hypothetical protein [Duganella sp. CF458]SFG37462.1 hypothetical protein SAMN05518865_111132 [Duganella sp. CF458]